MKKNTAVHIAAITLVLCFFAMPALAGPYSVPSKIPDSGQRGCYNDTAEIPCPSPGQEYYGQDGNYNINPMSFTKLDSGGNPLSGHIYRRCLP